MKNRIFAVIAVCSLLIGLVGPARAEVVPPHLLIVEVQTSQLDETGAVKAGNDFVEIFNPTSAAVDVTGWKLQYRSAANTGTWASSATKRTIACAAGSPIGCAVTVASGGRLVFATYDVPNVDEQRFTSGGFSDDGGQLRLLQPGGGSAEAIVHDMVGYGTAVESEGSKTAPAPTTGKSLKRKLTEDGYFIDTNVNKDDFKVSCLAPTPSDTMQITPAQSECPSTTTPIEDPTPTPETPGSGTPQTYAPLLLTELLPDPASPEQDDTDEFIEIYNPNDQEVNLTGYVVRAGPDFRYRFTLSGKLGAKAYVALRSSQTHVTLSNSGTVVQILNPAGAVVDESLQYGDAKEGQSWMRDDAGWHWTTVPTPGGTNTLVVPPPVVAAAAKPKTVKATTASAAKPKAAAVPKVPKSTTTTAKAAAVKPEDIVTPPPPNYWILLPIGAATLGYAAFEYRQDVSRALYKIRRSIGENR